MLVSENSYSLRIGVTGTRNLGEPEKKKITHNIKLVLEACRKKAQTLATAEQSLLRLFSPLAEGADRLVAHLAMEIGFQLEVVTPFSIEEYRKDFDNPATKGVDRASCHEEFDQLVRQAHSCLELDGARDCEAASYEAVGRVVVRNCDLLIAIWDGNEGAGRGGTADTVRFAVEHGVPVWWVWPELQEPGWITTLQQTSAPSRAPNGVGALAKLDEYLEGLQMSAPVPQHEHRGFFARIAQIKRRDPVSSSSVQRRLGGGVYKKLETLLAWGVESERYRKRKEEFDPAWIYWRNIMENFDNVASSNMNSYRSSYVMVFILAAFALIASIGALAWLQAKFFFTVIEFIFLFALAVIIVRGERARWHATATRARFSAELARGQSFLSLLADSISIPPKPTNSRELQQFAAQRRAAPLVSDPFTKERLTSIIELIEHNLLWEQAVYHRNRYKKLSTISHRLATAGEALFLATFTLVGLKIILLTLHANYGLTFTIGIFSAIVPAFAAFSVAIRSYAEFDVLSEHSRHMEQIMKKALEQLYAVDVSGMNASQRIADVLREVADAMLRDVDGWTTLTQAKALEAG